MEHAMGHSIQHNIVEILQDTRAPTVENYEGPRGTPRMHGSRKIYLGMPRGTFHGTLNSLGGNDGEYREVHYNRYHGTPHGANAPWNTP